MKTRLVLFCAISMLVLSGCGKREKEGGLAEAGRWEDKDMPALFLIYYLDGDLSEAALKERLKPIARKHAARYGFVIQIAVHDKDYATRLASPETRARYECREFMVGTEILTEESAKTKGGMVYTYYREGDYDEWFYLPKM